MNDAMNQWQIASFNRAVNSQSTDAAVRKDIEPDVRSHARIHNFIKEVPRVRVQLCPSQHRFPNERGILQSLKRHISAVAAFEGTALGKVSFEMRCVDFNAAQ